MILLFSNVLQDLPSCVNDSDCKLINPKFSCNKTSNECQCKDPLFDIIQECKQCKQGYKLYDKQCYEDFCGPLQSESQGECYDSGKCVLVNIKNLTINNTEYVFQCECVENADPAYYCRICKDGWRWFSKTCLPSVCGQNCNFHGNCVLTNDNIFKCKCFNNYDESTQCEKCNYGFDSEQNCLVCKPGYKQVFQDNRLQCISQQLSVGEISGVVVGVTALVFLIIGIVYLIYLKKNRFYKEESTVQNDEENEIYV